MIIQHLVVSEIDVYPQIDGIVRDRSQIRLADDRGTGVIRLPEFGALMANQYLGLGVEGEAVGLEIAALKGENYWQWTGAAWQIAAEPVYYSVGNLRSQLLKWAGPLQLELRLTRTEGKSPTVKSVRVGYSVTGDLLYYLLYSVLVRFCNEPVWLDRFTQTLDGTTVSIPSGFEASRIPAAKVLQPETQWVEAAISNGQVVLSSQVSAGIVQLQFAYSPFAEVVTGVYQIEKIPSVLLSPVTPINRRRMVVPDWIEADAASALLAHSPYICDYPVLVSVVGQRMDDVRAIANNLVTHFSRQGSLYADAFGLTVPVHVTRGVTNENPMQDDTNLFRVSFDILLLHLPEGMILETVPLLVEYDRDFSPKETP